jgi:pimeloyl-ACP methyl ester carboxylesterase
LKDFLDALGIEKAALIGNSMGGGIAWAFAGLFPERVSHLILISAAPPDVLDRVTNESFRTLVAIRDLPLLPYILFGSRTKRSIRWMLHECVSDKTIITPEVMHRQYKLSMIKGSTWPLYSTFKNGEKGPELRDLLSKIHRPTLLIWGEEDLIFPPCVGLDLQQSIKNSEFRLIPRSGHIPMWETPEPVNQAILAFLKENA